ncbi:MAG TPA: hypothetical protein VMT16_09630 [Thermoanaerobaculia bacterium]|nr:hypothetical protein [Thermoanaerobaculia bacterium]
MRAEAADAALPGRRRLVALLTACLLAATLAWAVSAAFYGTVPGDDAFITFRYAENWLAGHGPVWNPGERVEGYSNPLFLALMTLLAALGMTLPGAAALVNLLGLATVLAVIVLWSRELADDDRPGWLAAGVAGVVLLHPATALYLHQGLETLQHAGLVALALFVVRRGVRSPAHLVGAAALAAALAISRPEGILMTAVVGAFCLAGRGDRLRRPLLFVLPAAVLIGSWIALRWSFYGDLLPNTYYVKLAAPLLRRLVRGVEYVADGGAVLLFAPLLLAPLWRLDTPQRRRSMLVLVVGLLAVLVFPLLAGGDWMRGYRFLVPALPFAAVLWGAGVGALWGASSQPLRWLRLLAAAVAVAAILARVTLAHVELARASREDGAWVAAHAALGGWLREQTPPGSLIALGAVGAVGFYSDRPVLDCWGLNDAWIARHGRRAQGLTMAHQTYDGRYVWRRRPEWVFPLNGPLSEPVDERTFRRLALAPGEPSRFWAAELMAQPGFAGAYAYRTVEVAPGVWFGAYLTVADG